MKNRINLGLDKLEVCYTTTPENYEELKDTKYREYDGFRIHSTETDSNAKESYLQIDIRHPVPDGTLDWVMFGTIKVGSTFADEDSPSYVWIRVHNRMLYTPHYPDTPTAYYIYYISESLSLSYNNITKLDIAADSNANYFARIKRAIRNMELVPIVLGSAYPERKEIIKKLLYIHTADRERYRTGTVSISSSEKDFALSVYNKSEEIAESNKEYIKDWTSLSDTIHRVEVRLKRTAIKDYLTLKGMTLEELYYNLFDKETQFRMFSHFSDKLLRFRSGREVISVMEL